MLDGLKSEDVKSWRKQDSFELASLSIEIISEPDYLRAELLLLNLR